MCCCHVGAARSSEPVAPWTGAGPATQLARSTSEVSGTGSAPGTPGSGTPSRLEALRERMNRISIASRIGEKAKQVDSPLAPQLQRPGSGNMNGTMAALQERMASLRRKTEPQ